MTISRSESPTLGFPYALSHSTDPLVHPHPLFTRLLPQHDPILFDLDLLPSLSRRSLSSSTPRQSLTRLPSFSSVLSLSVSRHAIYLPNDPDPDVPPTLSPSSSSSSSSVSSPDLDNSPSNPLDTAEPRPNTPSHPPSQSPSQIFLALSDDVPVSTVSHASPINTSVVHVLPTEDAKLGHTRHDDRDIDSIISKKSDQPKHRTKFKAFISRWGGAPPLLTVSTSSTSASTTSSPLAFFPVPSSSTSSSTSPKSPSSSGTATPPNRPGSESCPASPVAIRPTRSFTNPPSLRSVASVIGPLNTQTHATATSQLYSPTNAPVTRPWNRRSGGGGRRAYNPSITSTSTRTTPSSPVTPTTPDVTPPVHTFLSRPPSKSSLRSTGRARANTLNAVNSGTSVGIGGLGMGLGLSLLPADARSKSHINLVKKDSTDQFATPLEQPVKGKGKKMLVVRGLEIDDDPGALAVRAWCEEFGEVRNITRTETGTLHIEFRKASVADKVCCVQADVHIHGAGTVSLSWFTTRK